MKKILLGTSALIGAATLFAGTALASDPTVTIGGFSTFEAGWSHSDFTSESNGAAAATKNHEVAFRNDNEIHFNVAGKTDQGLGYGAEIDLQADINGSPTSTQSGVTSAAGSSGSGIVARRTYGWLQGDQWGHVEYGSNDGVARNLKVDASNIARATGGIDGDFIFFAAANNFSGPATVGTFTGGNTASRAAISTPNNFITSPRLPIEAGPATSFASDVWGNDSKITYYTPRYQGFQLGVSYIPQLVDRGELTTTTVTSTGTGLTGAANLWEYGANYEGQYDQVGIAVAATGENGKADNGGNNLLFNVENLGAWNAGAKLSYMGWSAAGSYGDWSDSFASDGISAKYWTGGLAYETGPIGVSVTYLGSQTTATNVDNKFQDVSVGADYKLAPGLTPFIEYTWYDIDPTVAGAGAAPENKGNVVIIGSQLSF